MKINSGFLLLLSRYVTYTLVFITSILSIGEDLGKVLLFSLLFLLVLINSYIRINKLTDHISWFVISVLIELPIIVYMQCELSGISFVYFYIPAVDIFLTLNLGKAVVLLTVLYISMMTSIYISSSNMSMTSFVINCAICGGLLTFFAGSAYIIRFETMTNRKIQNLNEELKKSKLELEEANTRLSEYAEKVEQISILNERNRMAGEIHDTIGHTLTALIMEVDACIKLIDKDAGKTKEELGKASALARSALSEVRRSVQAIKPQDFAKHTGIKAIEELIGEFQKSTGVIVKFNVSKKQYKLSPAVDVTIYRMVQEALTNCAKHSRGDTIFINMRFTEKDVSLDIRDNGVGCVDFIKGIGLKTMEERIISLGGNIELSGMVGFSITASIPVEVS